MTKKELINKIAGKSITLTKAELKKKEKINDVWEEIAIESIQHTRDKTNWHSGYQNIVLNDDYLYRLEFSKEGIRYYEGTEERYLDIPVGEENWHEPQWKAKEIKMLIEGLEEVALQ